MALDESVEVEDGAVPENWLYEVPPTEAVQKAERARKELEKLGAEVRFEAKWWGFEVHLNQEAVNRYLEIKGLIEDILTEALKDPLAKLVALAAMAQKLWVEAVSRGYGCKLVSPWISPTMLIPKGLGPQEDLNMWWTVFEPGQGWNEDQKFVAHQSGANPALASFNGRLVCVHRGGTDNHLWYTSFDPDSGWTQDTKIGGMSTDGPALAVFGGKLHCVYKAYNSNDLWHATYDGTRWSSPHSQLPRHQSARGPALAAFKGRLHLVHRGGGSDLKLYHATFDGSSWSNDIQLRAHQTASNPALAEYDGKLHLLHRGGGDTKLYHATLDGSSWSDDLDLPAHQSLEGPTLAVLGRELYCIHRGQGKDDQNLYWTKYPTNGGWSPDQKFPGHMSDAGPGAVVYKDKNGTHDQIMVVHRGRGNRAAGTDTAEVEARLAAEQAAAGTPDA